VGADNTGEKQERRGGRFRKGQSGNPAGRPRGSRNRVTQLCADLLGGDAEAIMGKLIKLAKSGKPYALRLAVERLIPARGARDRAVAFELPGVAVAADLATAAAAVIGHAASGDITLSEAREFMALLEAQRKVMETTDLVVRLEALEAGAGLPAVTVRDEYDPEVKARVRRLLSADPRLAPPEGR
jgi:hypothetical protein